ncbi:MULTISPECIES: nuclear transport factor 2 family protein [Arenibacter]|uniref:nuclear transport factor 2 family protein n=1 Tax=Arenibacter TaxID=178469 RepID=UPI000A36F851|nr:MULTISPECIES: nuclear transport factor 2 family protein [Arenibacter]
MNNLYIFFVALMAWFPVHSQENLEKEAVRTVLEEWHLAASEARFQDYFNAMSEEAIFIGTEAGERWDKEAFMAYAKPHFDKGKAWSFKILEQHLYFNEAKDMVWFDELLDTQMKLCRGSGVLQRIHGEWKISHYVLSIVIPNENVSEVVRIKQETDNEIIEKFKKQ